GPRRSCWTPAPPVPPPARHSWTPSARPSSDRSHISWNTGGRSVRIEAMLDSKDLRRTVVIENVEPVVDGGRYPVKREVGIVLEVTADIFKEGHEVLRAFLKYRRADESTWRETPMRFVDNDRWAGAFTPTDNARYLYAIEALADAFASWLADFAKRVDAGQDVASEL